jgi:hypothetical protein
MCSAKFFNLFVFVGEQLGVDDIVSDVSLEDRIVAGLFIVARDKNNRRHLWLFDQPPALFSAAERARSRDARAAGSNDARIAAVTRSVAAPAIVRSHL